MNEEPLKLPRFQSFEQAVDELNVSDAANRPPPCTGGLSGYRVGGRGQSRTGIDDLKPCIDEAYREVAQKVARCELIEIEIGEE